MDQQGGRGGHRPARADGPDLHGGRSALTAAARYWLYLLECEGGVYYAGIALDVEKRFYQHLFGTGARFTRAWPPLRILAAREYPTKGDALRAELQLKALPRARKPAFFAP